MKTIYTEIKKQLLEQVPALRQVSMNTGQLSVPYSDTSRPPVAYPVVLLDIDINSTSDLTTDVQLCRGRVILTISTDIINSIDDDKATAPYQLVADIYAALQGYHTENFNPLTRTSARRKTPSGNKAFFEYELCFELEFIDETAKKE